MTKTRLLTIAAVFAAMPVRAQNIGTAFSGPTTADGASAYYNPAAMNRGRSRIELDLGAAFASLEYAPNTGPAPSSANPVRPFLTLGAYTDALHEDVRLGISIGIPDASGGTWSLDDGAAQITRYYLNDGTTFHLSAIPALSWAPLEWLSMGIGAHITYGTVSTQLDKDFGAQLNQTAGSTTIDSPFPYADARFAAPVELEGSGFGIGASLGILAQPIPELAIGVSIQTPVKVSADGNVDVEYPQALIDAVADILPTAELPDLNGTIGSDLDIPWMVHAGVSVWPIPELEIAAYYRWEDTSSQPYWNVRIIEATSPDIADTARIQGYDDRHFVQLRMAYSPLPILDVAVFGSLQTNTIPSVYVSPNNLDFTRYTFGLAARWRIVEAFSLTVQYSYLFLPDRTIDESLHRPLTQPALANFNHPSPTGTYSGNAHGIMVGLSVHLGGDDSRAEVEPPEVQDDDDYRPEGMGLPEEGATTEPSSEEETDDTEDAGNASDELGAEAAGSDADSDGETNSSDPAWYEGR